MIFDRLFGKPKSEKPDGEEKVGAFERLRRGLGKTRDALTSLFGMGRKLESLAGYLGIEYVPPPM